MKCIVCFVVVVHSGGIQNIMNGQTTVCSEFLEGNDDGLVIIHATCCIKKKNEGHIYVLSFFILLEPKKVNRTKRYIVSSPENLSAVHKVPMGVPFYLSCPIHSYHAVYTWEHGGQSSPCLQMQSNCLHLIPAMAQENYGDYECISKEKDYTKVVIKYQLTEQLITERKMGSDSSHDINDASAAVSQTVLIILGLAVEMLH